MSTYAKYADIYRQRIARSDPRVSQKFINKLGYYFIEFISV